MIDKEQIIQMAREAGINVSQGHLLRFVGVEDDLERFAAAIRAVTKEEDAKICEEECDSWQAWPQAGAAKRKILEAIRASK